MLPRGQGRVPNMWGGDNECLSEVYEGFPVVPWRSLVLFSPLAFCIFGTRYVKSWDLTSYLFCQRTSYCFKSYVPSSPVFLPCQGDCSHVASGSPSGSQQRQVEVE